MAENDKPVSSEGRRRAILEVTTAIVAILSVAVAIVFGLRSEREKSLTLRYIALRPLISGTERAPRRLEVMYEGQTLTQPYLLSARLENTGGAPIEERDIERSLTLAFTNAHVIGVELGERHPTDLSVSASHDSSSVVVSHRLLNPGDWLTFDILLDGHPSLPSASLRITGVRSIEILTPSAQLREARPTFFALPTLAVYAVLIVVSGLGAVLLGVGFFGLGSAGKAFLVGSGAVASQIQAVLQDPVSLGHRGWVGPRELPEVAERLGPEVPFRVRIEMFDRPERVRRRLRPFQDELRARAVTPDEAADLILTSLRRHMPKAVARTLYRQLPAPIDEAASAKVQSIPFVETTVAEYLQKVQKVVQELALQPGSTRGWRAVDRDDLLFGFASLVIGLAVALGVAGAWRLALP